MVATDAARPRHLLVAIIAGIVLTIAFGLVSFVTAAGGEGTYVPAALFFPGALLLAIALNLISNSVLWMAAAQWPLYGAVVSLASRKGNRKLAIVSLTLVHALLVAACFLLDRSGQFL
jgi:hypothetical protein